LPRRSAPTPAAFAVFDALLLFGTLLSLLFLPGRPSWLSVVVVTAVVASPLVLLYSGIVWKDVLFAASATAGFVASAHAAARWEDARRRYALLALAALCLALATLARHNANIIVPFAALAIGWTAARASNPPSLRRGAVFGLAWLAATAAVVVLAELALQTRSDRIGAMRGLMKDLQVYDLAGSVHAEPALTLDFLHDRAPELEELLRTKAAPAYSPLSIGSIKRVADFKAAVLKTPASVISTQWREVVLEHPLVYLRQRAGVFAGMLSRPDRDWCTAAYTGVKGPEQWMTKLGLIGRMDRRDELLAAYVDRLRGTPVFSHAAYALVAIVLAVVLVLRRRPPDVAIAALLLGALAYSATFFFLSVCCDYRFLYFLDLAAMAAVLYVTIAGGADA
jgi:hypothetical protein